MAPVTVIIAHRNPGGNGAFSVVVFHRKVSQFSSFVMVVFSDQRVWSSDWVQGSKDSRSRLAMIAASKPQWLPVNLGIRRKVCVVLLHDIENLQVAEWNIQSLVSFVWRCSSRGDVATGLRRLP